MFFRMLYDEKLAQASYVIGCQRTGQAIVIDPQRDIERYIRLAAQEGLQIVAAAETHIHADFLSGARELAERTGARLYLSDEGDEDWKYQWLDKKSTGGSYDYQLLRDGDQFMVGNVQFTVLHTPGHTPEHISFLVTDRGSGATEPMGIITGDFVFVGDVGRPDLLETAAGQQGAKEVSARQLFLSLQRFKTLPDFLQLWPGHGAGSACGKALGAVPQSTVGYEKRFNPAVASAEEEQDFVEQIIYGQPEPPLYFARMKKWNKEGPPLLGKLPEPDRVDVAQVVEALQQGAVLLDTRDWPRFTRGHLPGALFAPLNKAFPTVAGSYVLPEQDIYLLVEPELVREAVLNLIRIGLDRVVGFITREDFSRFARQGHPLQQIPSLPIDQLDPQELSPDALLLDVRYQNEYDAGHLPGARHIAHTRLLAQLEEIPADKQLYVYCRTSNRSAYASAFLQKSGRQVVHLYGGFEAWARAGKPYQREKLPVS